MGRIFCRLPSLFFLEGLFGSARQGGLLVGDSYRSNQNLLFFDNFGGGTNYVLLFSQRFFFAKGVFYPLNRSKPTMLGEITQGTTLRGKCAFLSLSRWLLLLCGLGRILPVCRVASLSGGSWDGSLNFRDRTFSVLRRGFRNLRGVCLSEHNF